ncbi:MAG: hypothetical protein U0936_23020 [Planctomycetaceae bacterium]
MLERRGQPPGPPAEMMAAHFQKHLQTVDQWLGTQRNIQVFNCEYAELIQRPVQAAAAIQEFLNVPLDARKMVDCVVPELHRQRV